LNILAWELLQFLNTTTKFNLARGPHPGYGTTLTWSTLAIEKGYQNYQNRGRILGHNWDKSSLLFTLLTDFTPPPPLHLRKSGLKLVCNVNIVYGNLKSENSQDYAPKLNEMVRS
jgi:hypothetical protein